MSYCGAAAEVTIPRRDSSFLCRSNRSRRGRLTGFPLAVAIIDRTILDQWNSLVSHNQPPFLKPTATLVTESQ